MPRVDIWIRKEDYAKWLSIEDKPEWLHEHLSKRGRPVYPLDDPHPGELHNIPIEPKLTPPEDAA